MHDLLWEKSGGISSNTPFPELIEVANYIKYNSLHTGVFGLRGITGFGSGLRTGLGRVFGAVGPVSI